MEQSNTYPHRVLMQDEGLNIQDLPDSAQNIIRRFNEKEKTYLSTKKRFDNKGEEWDKKQEFEDALLELDEDAQNKITRFLEQRDGNTELAQRAIAVNLPAQSSEAEIIAAEKKRTQLAERAKAVDLSEGVSEAKIIEAEKAKTAAAAKTAEETAAAAAKKAEESKLPRNELALKKLLDAGKTKVTYADLKGAGFDMGFFTSPIGMSGCQVGAYRLYRASQYDTEFELSKI